MALGETFPESIHCHRGYGWSEMSTWNLEPAPGVRRLGGKLQVLPGPSGVSQACRAGKCHWRKLSHIDVALGDKGCVSWGSCQPPRGIQEPGSLRKAHNCRVSATKPDAVTFVIPALGRLRQKAQEFKATYTVRSSSELTYSE